MRVNATYAFEVEVTFTGTVNAAEPDVGLGESLDDLDVEDFGIVVYSLKEKRHITNSILDGVDTTSPAWMRFVSNLLDAVRAEVEEALIEASADD